MAKHSIGILYSVLQNSFRTTEDPCISSIGNPGVSFVFKQCELKVVLCEV